MNCGRWFRMSRTNISSNFALGWNAYERTHNSALCRVAVWGDAWGYLMNGGDYATRSLASTVLDNYFNFTVRGGSYRKDIDYIHRKFAEDVKAGLYPKMSEEELHSYLTRETLKDNGEDEFLFLLFNAENLDLDVPVML